MRALIESLSASKFMTIGQRIHDAFDKRYSWNYSQFELGFDVPESEAEALKVVKKKVKGFEYSKDKRFPDAKGRSPLAGRRFDHLFQSGDMYVAVINQGFKYKGKIPVVRVLAFTTDRKSGVDFRQTKDRQRGSRFGTGKHNKGMGGGSK